MLQIDDLFSSMLSLTFSLSLLQYVPSGTWVESEFKGVREAGTPPPPPPPPRPPGDNLPGRWTFEDWFLQMSFSQGQKAVQMATYPLVLKYHSSRTNFQLQSTGVVHALHTDI